MRGPEGAYSVDAVKTNDNGIVTEDIRVNDADPGSYKPIGGVHVPSMIEAPGSSVDPTATMLKFNEKSAL